MQQGLLLCPNPKTSLIVRTVHTTVSIQVMGVTIGSGTSKADLFFTSVLFFYKLQLLAQAFECF